MADPCCIPGYPRLPRGAVLSWGGNTAALLEILATNSGSSNINQNQTRFLGFGGAEFSASEPDVEILWTRAGICRNLYVRAFVNGRPNATPVTVRRNGANTILLVSIPAGSTALVTDLVNSFAVVAGDRLSVGVVTGATAGALGQVKVSMEFVPT